jgi:hypothetical protein
MMNSSVNKKIIVFYAILLQGPACNSQGKLAGVPFTGPQAHAQAQVAQAHAQAQVAQAHAQAQVAQARAWPR